MTYKNDKGRSTLKNRIIATSAFVVILSMLGLGKVDAETISGFQQLSFGMTLEDAQSIQHMSLKSEEDGLTLYRATEDINVLGNIYSQELTFNSESILIKISLFREEPIVNKVDCSAEFSNIFAPISSRYCQPDEPINQNVISADVIFTSASFTKTDGSSIKILVVFVSSNCLINVLYTGGFGGAQF